MFREVSTGQTSDCQTCCIATQSYVLTVTCSNRLHAVNSHKSCISHCKFKPQTVEPPNLGFWCIVSGWLLERQSHRSVTTASLLLCPDGRYILITYVQVRCSKVERSNPQTTKCQHRNSVPWRVVAFIACKWHISLYWVQMLNRVTSELKCWFLQRSNPQTTKCQHRSSVLWRVVALIACKWHISIYCVQMWNRVTSELECRLLKRPNGQRLVGQYESSMIQCTVSFIAYKWHISLCVCSNVKLRNLVASSAGPS